MAVEDPASVQFTLNELFGAIITGIVIMATWILKKLGDQHIKSIDDLTKEIGGLRKDLSALSERTAILETKDQLQDRAYD